MNPDATYKFVDIIEVPTDEIEYTTEDDILDDSNWPPPIPGIYANQSNPVLSSS